VGISIDDFLLRIFDLNRGSWIVVRDSGDIFLDLGGL